MGKKTKDMETNVGKPRTYWTHLGDLQVFSRLFRL